MIPPPSFDTDYLKIPKQLYEKVHHDGFLKIITSF